jgi:hypothetical protein
MCVRFQFWFKTNSHVKQLIVLALSIFLISCGKTVQPTDENVFSAIKHDKVIAYDYNGEGDIEIIDKNGQLAKEIKKSIELNRSQVAEITNLLSDRSTYGDNIAMCFNPHFGIVFYEGEKVNAYISICLECNYLISSVNIPAAISGFSKTGSDGIISFQKDVGLYYGEK